MEDENPFRSRIHKNKVFQSLSIKWPCQVLSCSPLAVCSNAFPASYFCHSVLYFNLSFIYIHIEFAACHMLPDIVMGYRPGSSFSLFFGGSWACLFLFARSDETRGKEINLRQCVSGGKTYILILSTIYFSYTNVISKQPLFRCLCNVRLNHNCSICMYSLQLCGEFKWLRNEISRETQFTALTGRLRNLSDSNSQQTLVVHHARPKPVLSFYLTWDGVVRSLHLSPPRPVSKSRPL